MKLKKIFSISLIFCILLRSDVFASDIQPASSEYEKRIVNNVPQSATDYIYSQLPQIMELATFYKNELGIEVDNIYKITIGTPYVITSLDEESQDEIYYYPILDEYGVIQMVAAVGGTSGGWRMSISTDMVDRLNELNYTEEDFLFVESEDNIVATNEENEAIVVEGDVNDTIGDFADQSFSDQISEVEDNLDEGLVKSNLKEKITNVDDEYTRKFLINRTSQKVLAQVNPQGQNGYSMCWAATASNIINYVKGKNVSGMNICDSMGKSYNDGGDVFLAADALAKYGLSQYKVIDPKTNLKIIGWKDIKKNIDNKYPVYISSSAGKDSGHAVVVYGYHITSGGRNYIWMWNPGLNGGKGEGQIVEYRYTGTVYQYNNKNWIYKGSIGVY